MFATTVLGFVAGLLIGCAGVGGVIIVPILVQIGGLDVFAAITVAMAGYILTGFVGTSAYIRGGALDWRLAPLLCLSAMPTAVVGSLAAKAMPPFLLELAIGLMCLSSGLHAQLKRPCYVTGVRTSLSRPAGLSLGAVTGFVSALTGTGGPACLIPLLLWMDVAVLNAVGLAQVIQLPIAGLATITNILHGGIDLPLGLVLGAGLSTGTWFGARIAHRLDDKVLRRLVCLMLIGVGILMLAKAVLHGGHLGTS